jgi:hypothetical protein
MSTGTLHWYEDRGFELDLEAAEDDVAMRLVAVPVPADGTEELRSGVELDRLDILFKAIVEIQGEPAQLHEARVQLVVDGGNDLLEIDARCEDVETGDILPLKLSVAIRLPARAPERGGPRPVPQNEDDLDWEDETTLEQLVVNAPETGSSGLDLEDEPAADRATGGRRSRSSRPPEEPEPEPFSSRAPASRKPFSSRAPASASRASASRKPSPAGGGKGKGRAANGDGLTRGSAAGKGKASGKEKAAAPEPSMRPATPARRGTAHLAQPEGASETPKNGKKGGGRAKTSAPPSDKGYQALLRALARLDTDEDADQSMGADGEAKGLLDLLVGREHLELEGDADVGPLVPGVAQILALPIPHEAKATRLSTWLLEQDEVADLFIGDEQLAELLEHW